MKLSKIKANPSNPRVIKDDKFKKLVQSLKDFPEMMEKRPLVCVTDTDGKIYPLGGNMRLRALQELGYKDIPDNWVMMADDWNEDKRREFIIKDNLNYGEWDWDELANNWDIDNLNDWGLNLPDFAKQLDYSLLEDEDLSENLIEMQSNVKKSILIEFQLEHYEQAYNLIKFWRERGAYVGYMIMQFLQQEKDKL